MSVPTFRRHKDAPDIVDLRLHDVRERYAKDVISFEEMEEQIWDILVNPPKAPPPLPAPSIRHEKRSWSGRSGSLLPAGGDFHPAPKGYITDAEGKKFGTCSECGYYGYWSKQDRVCIPCADRRNREWRTGAAFSEFA